MEEYYIETLKLCITHMLRCSNFFLELHDYIENELAGKDETEFLVIFNSCSKTTSNEKGQEEFEKYKSFEEKITKYISTREMYFLANYLRSNVKGIQDVSVIEKANSSYKKVKLALISKINQVDFDRACDLGAHDASMFLRSNLKEYLLLLDHFIQLSKDARFNVLRHRINLNDFKNKDKILEGMKF